MSEWIFLTGHEPRVGYCSLKSLKVWIVITQHRDEDYDTKTKKKGCMKTL